jgi:glycosyltransferase involved in cell wall biosynthesis
LVDKVAFIQELTQEDKQILLDNTQILMVTGKNQGFSIWQVEAMARGIILLASNSGGSLETIVHEYTGYLLPTSSDLWAQTLK